MSLVDVDDDVDADDGSRACGWSHAASNAHEHLCACVSGFVCIGVSGMD